MIDLNIRRYTIGVVVLVAAIVVFFLAKGLIKLLLILALGCAFIHWLLPGWFGRKVEEWRTDFRQLLLWAQMAFKRNRDAADTATMVHQHQFLDGRMISPLNVFTLLPLVIGAVGIAWGMFGMWNAERAARQRDAPCSRQELTRNHDGDFRTTRQSCADLGATAEQAERWETAANEARSKLQENMNHIRAEADRELARAASDAATRRRLITRQRSRENEAIEAALGGPPPDLDRSLCDLSGQADCGPRADDHQPAAAPAPAGMPNPGPGSGGPTGAAPP